MQTVLDSALRRTFGTLLICLSALALVLFLILGAYQLQLPGLHYDEAKEAGLNAMQLVTGQSLTAFRDAAIQIGPWRLPLMVQDYIGALNPLLAVPFLAVAGLGHSSPDRAVVALRWLPLLIGALTLVLTCCVARYLGGLLAAASAALLLAVNPAFVFWSRQGVFVTNLTSLFFMAALLTGLRWWHERRPSDLWLAALFCGLGLYAKLLFVWALGAMAIVAIAVWLIAAALRRAPAPDVRPVPRRAHGADGLEPVAPPAFHSTFPFTASILRPWLVAALFFLLPLVPLIIFNLRTEGTLLSVFGNLGHSYYGVNNRAYLPNLSTRLQEFAALLRGDFFWYLGEVYANPYTAPVLAFLVLAATTAWLAGLARARRLPVPAVAPGRPANPPAFLLPVALIVLIVAQSAFTVSDLFITHYSLLLPLVPLAAGLAAAAVWQATSPLRVGYRYLLLVPILVALLLVGATDLRITRSYHRILGITGGISGHSDAIGSLAAYLSRSEPSAPLALDWGLDAPIRFLTTGQVNPIEVFDYASMDHPDDGFAARLSPFLDNPDNVYLAHDAGATVFRGRVEALTALAAQHGLVLYPEAIFRERSGRPLLIVYRTRAR
jgi:hypothetical protein